MNQQSMFFFCKKFKSLDFFQCNFQILTAEMKNKKLCLLHGKVFVIKRIPLVFFRSGGCGVCVSKI